MENFYDVIVIGGGPAGLTAALYLSRARYRVLVLEKEQFGGQISITHEVVNYPGIEKTSGKMLTETMRRQAEAFGAEFLLAEALSLNISGDLKVVETSRGSYRCFGLLLATGAHPRAVGFKGEEEYKGRGVAYCATCDGEFFTGKEIFVIGGGYAAAEESVFLTKFARHVTILIRKDDFSCAASVAESAKNHEKITILTNTVVEEVSGENGLRYIRYRNTATDQVSEYRAEPGDHFGVFVLAGYAPNTELINDLAERDPQGYVITDEGQKTSVDGLYAAGDVCVKPLRQVVTATGDGALAATELEKYVARLQQKTGLRAEAPRKAVANEPTEPEIGNSETDSHRFSPEMRRQLDDVFQRMHAPLLLKLYLDNRPVSKDLESFLTDLTALSPKLNPTVAQRDEKDEEAPYVSVCSGEGRETGLEFHGVPSGHEFSSFILGLYNAAGPGQPLDEETKRQIAAITKPTNLKLLVTLSCSMCPDLVTAAQRIAVENPNVTAHVYDIHHFEALKERYHVMSVPCMVINDRDVAFGKKNISEILLMLSRSEL